MHLTGGLIMPIWRTTKPPMGRINVPPHIVRTAKKSLVVGEIKFKQYTDFVFQAESVLF